ncbi:MAG: hypothetical protein Q9159_000077 [Coniocarpon cinnabarinum]
MSSKSQAYPAFLPRSSSPGTSVVRNVRVTRAVGLVGLVLFVLYLLSNSIRESFPTDLQDSYGAITKQQLNATTMHVLLPATLQDVNLCKTLVGLHILGYPTPTLLGWGDRAERSYSIDEGAHILSKITRSLEYLEQLPPDRDNDLVLLVDAYDTWFQLRSEVLISRYHHLNSMANRRLRQKYGRSAMKAGAMKQTVIFGAAKECSNQAHTLGCYPVPEPYTPRDMFGGNTDTVMGLTQHSSKRPKYLASGFIMGPVADLKNVLRKAQWKVDVLPDFDRDLDNGSGSSDFIYHGDDASIFARIFGEQEWMRESIRRNYTGSFAFMRRTFGIPSGNPGERQMVEGAVIKDVLEPDFVHEDMPPAYSKNKAEAMKEFEFYIGLDYGGDLYTQTHNAERDHAYIVYTNNHTDTLGEVPTELAHQQEWGKPMRKEDPKTIEQQIKEAWGDRTRFDCKPRLRSKLPQDIMHSKIPYAAAPEVIVTGDGGQSPQDAPSNTTWEEVRLYTNLCLGSTPAVLHHNGDRNLRERDWEKLWWQRWGSTLLELVKLDKQGTTEVWQRGPKDVGQLTKVENAGIGAWSDEGWFVGWNQACPRDFNNELYRGMEFDD